MVHLNRIFVVKKEEGIKFNMKKVRTIITLLLCLSFVFSSTVMASVIEAEVGAQGIYVSDSEANSLPIITSQPVDYTGIVGNNATFTVAATGEGIRYQWQVKTS